MIDSRYSLPGLSRRFQTLDWLPMGALYGNQFPAVGRNTDFPVAMTAHQAANIYWNPQQFAIISASITTTEYGTQTLANLPAFSGYRQGTSPAEECSDLLNPTGGLVQTEEEFDSTGTLSGRIIVRAIFQLNALAAMTPDAFWLSFFASLDVRPLSTNPLGKAATYIATDSPIDAGFAEVLQEKGEYLGATAPLVHKPAQSGSDCVSVSASIRIDYTPWVFAD